MKRHIYGIVKILALICLCAALVAPTLSSCGRAPDHSAATGEGSATETGAQSGEDAENGSEASPEDIPGGVGASRGEAAASEGLLFEYDAARNGYMVKGVGTCIDLEITIPARYDRVPVVGVSEGAFRGAGWITRVSIPESVRYIFDDAFSGCNSLAVVSLPSTLHTLRSNAFEGCDSLHTVYYNGDRARWRILYSPDIPGWGPDTLADAMIILSTGEVLNASEGLDFRMNGDGTCSLHGIGTCTDSVIRIPPVYDGRPVTYIDERAFYFDDWNRDDSAAHKITRVDIPEGVTYIGREVFCELDNLTAVSCPSTLRTIPPDMFADCDSLSTLYCNGGAEIFETPAGDALRENVTFITPNLGSRGLVLDSEMDFGLYYCNIIGHCTVTGAGDCSEDVVIAIPTEYNGFYVESIGEGAFKELSDLLRVVIYEGKSHYYGFERICERAFENCVNLTVVSLPSWLKKIEKDAFAGCTSLTTVYYSGSEEDWQEIEIGSGNECLTGATIIFGD